MTEPTPLVSEAFATGDEVAPIIARLEEALGDTSRTQALIALICMMLLVQHPNISAEEMYEGVRDVSRFTCLWLSGMKGSDTTIDLAVLDKTKMN